MKKILLSLTSILISLQLNSCANIPNSPDNEIELSKSIRGFESSVVNRNAEGFTSKTFFEKENVSSGYDMFMKIDGIPGESLDNNHTGSLEISGFKFGVSSSVNVISPDSAARSNFDSISILAKLDKTFPKIVKAASSGSHIKHVEINFARATGDKQGFLKYKLNDVVFNRVTLDTDEPKDKNESFSSSTIPFFIAQFVFDSIEISYTELDPTTGKSKGNVEYNWNVIQNSASN